KGRLAALDVEREKFRPKFRTHNATLPDDRGYREPGDLEPRDQTRFDKLKADYESKKAELAERWKQLADEVGQVQIKPRKTDIRVTHFGIAWVPYWLTTAGGKRQLAQA